MVNRSPSKLTFVNSYLEVCLSENLLDLCHMAEMFFKGATE